MALAKRTDYLPKAAPGKTTRPGRPAAQPLQIGKLATHENNRVEVQVYDILRRSLMRGAVDPGVLLSARTLAKRLGVSSMPVRGALKRLEAEHVIVSQARSGYRVAPMDAALYADITQIRMRLEGMAAGLAAERIDAKDLDRVRRWNRAVARSGENLRRKLHRNYGFHFEIYSAARSEILLSNIEMYWVRIGPALFKSAVEYDLPRMQPVHDALVDALARRDSKAAEEAVRADLSAACEAIVKYLDPAPRKV